MTSGLEFCPVFAAAKIDPPAQKMEKVSSGADQLALPIYFMNGMQIPEHEQGMRNKL